MHTYRHNNPQSSNSITTSNTDLERVRFSIGVAIFGGTIGGSAIIINFLSRFEFPNTPEHMNLISSIFLMLVSISPYFINDPRLAMSFFGIIIILILNVIFSLYAVGFGLWCVWSILLLIHIY